MEKVVPYYTKGIEVLDIIADWFPSSYHMGNVLKYVLRCKYKNDCLSDIEKAIHYLYRYKKSFPVKTDKFPLIRKIVTSLVRFCYTGNNINDIERALNNLLLFGRIYGVYGGVFSSKYSVQDVVDSYAPYNEFKEILDALYAGDIDYLILLLEDYYDRIQVIQKKA